MASSVLSGSYSATQVASSQASASATNHRERAAIGAVLCVALLMFFAPLISLHGAFIGDSPANALELSARLTAVRSSVATTSSAFAHRDSGATGSASEQPMRSVSLNVPASLSLEWLASTLIFAALGCAALALLSLFSSRKAVATVTLVGGFFGACAILHLFLMNADVRTWTSHLIESGMLGSALDPFVAMRMLMARSFELDPGIGLYVLTTCLFLASALSFSSAIPRMESVVRKSPRVQIAETIHVRPVDAQYAGETSTTLDVSQHGLYFATERRHYYAGMELRLTRSPRVGGPATDEERASVVRVRPLEDGKFGVAVRLISPTPPERVQ